MRVCGIELKGGEAIICILGHEKSVFDVPECRQRLFAITQSAETETIRKFQAAFKQLMQDYKVNEIAIIERDQKGKWAGSATSFKLEAAIQLLDMPVALVSQGTIKELIKRNPISADFNDLELKKFQQPAFNAAYAYINQCIFAKDD